ncbi:LON peptidase substrate-binding domain-containing protein [Pseudomonas sp. S1Bt30]|uniref:LON peptidase substrate-binding domain-containing protein n=1 Tax=Pseudomonas quebecensis TaxID=2995174 RepID=A0ABY6QI57_9PSED|nr:MULTISPECIES: LON peptidase substrate-binding domain-containing protein [Pseudomonas]MCX4064960.1 LON peptidase substrate-binding domain-containing protein [Pseudomonas quebecensis]UZW19203.1 LON peptidase substrate-binding domain-containing protein [Pseudomonas quebecensis]UZW23382.1 LON peptidase substrate-binding domain-containing protein [Pseudomonas quebecensis]UZW28444.1 LON peptidase substrate-binding domain-containing protein [Pseudomonas quebecensis]
MSLALFPLNTVLFPGCTLDLQIFEARYLDMIGRCMKKDESFGVVCILGKTEAGHITDAHAVVGCEALIRDFKQQDNGLLGIRVEGGRRFRVYDVTVQKDQLLLGEVHWLDEQPDKALEEEDEDLLALLQALAEHPMVASLDMDTNAEGQQALANQLAYLLPFTDDDKVRLLTMDSPQERLDMIQALLDELQGELFT